MLATRADTGEVLHARMRKGRRNTQRRARRFIDKLVARIRHAGATDASTIRFDSGFWSGDTIAVLNDSTCVTRWRQMFQQRHQRRQFP